MTTQAAVEACAAAISFADAAYTTLTRGQWAGRTIRDISTSDEGLKYLDWCRGESWFWSWPEAAEIVRFLDEPAIASTLRIILED